MTPTHRLRVLYDAIELDRLPVDTWIDALERFAHQRDTLRDRTDAERVEKPGV